MTRFDARPARRWAASALLLALPLSAWAKDPHLVVSGRVEVQDLTLQAPNLVAPTVNPDAGFAPAATGTATTATPASQAPANAPVSVASYAPVSVVSAVEVRQGDRVRAGQTLVRWDSRALDAHATAARTDVDVAKSQVDVIAANLDNLDDKEADLYDKRDQLSEAIDTMSSKRRELLRTADDLRGKRSQAADAVATLESKRAGVAGGVHTLTAKNDQLDDTIAALASKRAAVAAQLKQADSEPKAQQLRQALDEIDAGLAKARQGRSQLSEPLAQAHAGLAKIDGGLAQAKEGQKKLAAAEAKLADGMGQLNTNLAKARDGMSQIEDGLTKIADARTQLRRARTMADLAIDRAGVGVRQADDNRSHTTLVAPEDGIVASAPNLGDAFAPGATAVVLRPDRPTRVTTWLAPEQLAQVCRGDGVQVSGDWAGLNARGNLVRFGARADYPPTAQATDQVHLTRAVEVTVQVDGHLPPGVPVDVSINPCHPSDSTHK